MENNKLDALFKKVIKEPLPDKLLNMLTDIKRLSDDIILLESNPEAQVMKERIIIDLEGKDAVAFRAIIALVPHEVRDKLILKIVRDGFIQQIREMV